jgi:uncharacterized membrane protein
MRTDNRGQVLVIVALAFAVFLGFAALAVDVAYMYTTRNELQRCADSGALAGASRFTEPGGAWSPNPLDPVMIQAGDRARDYATRDEVVTTPLNPASEVAVAFPQVNQVRVDVSRNVGLFFARIFGLQTRAITAYAVASATFTPGPPPDNTVQLVE